MRTSLSISYKSLTRIPHYIYIYILKSHKGKNIWDFLKQFVSQIGIGYLGRLWVLGPLMNVEVGIKKSKSDEDKDEDGDINK